jgi:hypothetical protein
VLPRSLYEARGDRLPLPEILVDQPVDHVRDTTLDLLRRIHDDPIFELFLHTRAIHQVEQAPDSKRVFKERVTACFHLHEHLLDRRHSQLESCSHITAIDLELPLDVLQLRHIAHEQLQALTRD